MKNELRDILKVIIEEFGIINVTPNVERVADLSHGDYTTNIAMVLAKQLKRSPVEIAKEIVNKFKVQSSKFKVKERDLSTDQSGQKQSSHAPEINVLQDIEKIEVAPPGFINFHLSASTLSRTLGEVLEAKEAYGTVKSSQFAVRSSQKNKKELLPTANSQLHTKRIMVEFAHPNTHKAFHIGHLRNITTGESIIRLLESQGREVIRVNYQGDVGMHIAKALYALLRISNIKDQISKIREEDSQTKAKFLGEAYAAGSKAFEDPSADGVKAKEEIKDINYLIYAAIQRFNKERGIEPSSTDYMKFVHGRAVEVDQVYELWVSTRKWSLDYFDSIYARVGSHYDRFYFESECLSGVDDAKEAVKKGILKESEGAIIFDGKPYGLDTRVFVNSLGLPTYEAKELALAQKEFSEFGKPDKIIHVVGPEQASFFKVTFKVEELLGIQKDQQKHLIYGWVKLKHGKMSSRSGNVVLGEWLLDEAKKAILRILDRPSSTSHSGKPEGRIQNPDSGVIPTKVGIPQNDVGKYTSQEKEEIAEKAAVAAIKYSFLKVGTLQEIAFDIEESINFNGDSGPYLQYTYARCKSVMRKAEKEFAVHSSQFTENDIQVDSSTYNPEEKNILRLVERFPEVVTTAATNYAPSALCKYLYDLAGAYNTFYNKHSILGNNATAPINNPTQPPLNLRGGEEGLRGGRGSYENVRNFRLALTAATAQVLKNGLYLLGIEVLEQM